MSHPFYRIYYKQNALTISPCTRGIHINLNFANILRVKDPGEQELTILRKLFFNVQGIHIIICSEEVESIFQNFISLFRLVEGAGGIVFSEGRKVLLIYRNGAWDLPKGKIETGEPTEIAAVREVQEETGLKNVRIVKPMHVTHHVYIDKENPVLKKVYWFEMSTENEPVLIPQREEGIEKAQWVSLADLPYLLKNSYQTIQDTMSPYLLDRRN